MYEMGTSGTVDDIFEHTRSAAICPEKDEAGQSCIQSATRSGFC